MCVIASVIMLRSRTAETFLPRPCNAKTTISPFALTVSYLEFQEAVERLEANTSRQSSPKESDNGSASNSLDLEEAKVALNMEVKI